MRTDFLFLGVRVSIASTVRRRWLIAALYAAFAALVASWWFFVDSSSPYGWILFVAWALALRFLGGRSYTHGLVPSYEGGDERERTRRYRAHYMAYTWLDLLCIPALFTVFERHSPEVMAASPSVQLLLGRLAWALLIAVYILYLTLPQAILLWTEPDMEEE